MVETEVEELELELKLELEEAAVEAEVDEVTEIVSVIVLAKSEPSVEPKVIVIVELAVTEQLVFVEFVFACAFVP